MKLHSVQGWLHNGKRLFTVTMAILAWVFIMSQVNCSSGSSKADIDPYLNHNDTVSYVGIQTCASCHKEIYDQFIQTGMGRSFGAATRQRSSADFSGRTVVYDAWRDLSYHPFLKGDSLYVREFRLSGKDTVHLRNMHVDYIIGSGQHTNSHLMNVNGYVYQLPLTWYAQKKKWDLPPGFEDGHNMRFGREIGFECMSCHNAMPGYVANSGNRFTNIPMGIDCERCHGPGGLHVKEKLAGIRVDTATAIDYSIVNPKKLSFDRQTDVCQRCHLQGNAVLKAGREFSDFRPGMNLADFIEVYMPRYRNDENSFIMASHAQRLKMSRCFLSSGQKDQASLTCITCHNPHISVKVTGKEVFNRACMKCHNPGACKEAMPVRNTSNDNCVSCHMPKSGTIDIPHVRVTDHYIRVQPKRKQQEELKQFAELYCVNHPEAGMESRLKAWLSYVEKFEGEPQVLDSVALYISATGDKPETDAIAIHLLYMRHDYLSIVKRARNRNPLDEGDPWTAYRIGQACQNMGEIAGAKSWYARATNLAPDNLDFNNKYGTALILAGEPVKAMELYERLTQLNPYDAECWTNYGFACVSTNAYAMAMRCYDKAITLDPDFQQALLNKAALCNRNGDAKQARTLLQRILKRDPDNEQVIALLKSL